MSIRDEIREAFVHPPNISGGYGAVQRGKLFDAWERHIQAEAIREAAKATRDAPTNDPGTAWFNNDSAKWLEERADIIEKGSSDV